jgi:predicted MFS family arabinose efflux permease
VPLLRRVARLIWGDEVDRALRPVLGVGLAGSVAGSTLWTFVGIWAIREVGASSGQLAFAFLVGAALAGASGYLGGHLSDYLGRRPLILVGWGAMAVYVLGFPLVAGDVLTGLVWLSLAGLVGSLGSSVTQAMVADLVARDRHEAAYAAVRVANNLGVTLGPPTGGLLLLLGGWTALFLGASAFSAAALLLAARFLPRRGAYAPEGPPERGSFGVIRRDHAFLLFLVSGTLAYVVYVSFEVALPISLTDTHGVPAHLWGFLVVLNPLMVTLFQLRLTAAVAGVPPAPKLVAAMLLMGLPFLLLSVTAAVPVVALVILVFVIGEMLWVPTSQSIAAGMAPVDLRGAYMGAFGSTGAVGFALAPFVGLQIRGAAGDTAMWAFFAAVSVVAAFTGAIACRVALERVRRARASEAELPPGLPVEPAAFG